MTVERWVLHSAFRRAACVGLVCFAAGCAGTAGVKTSPTTPSFADFDRRARRGERLSVVFFGGSLTWGANASDPQRTSYRALMGRYLQRRYPRAPLTFHDAAIGGTGSKLGLFRLDRDVLARKPDLVLLDFTANDDLGGRDVQTLAAYETILRELIGRGVPIVQVLLGFRYNFQPAFDPKTVPRYLDHLKLHKAYRTALGDMFPYIQQRLREKLVTLDGLWPIDGVHPGDKGYQLFYQAARDGFDEAVRTGRRCVVPDEPVFGPPWRHRQRIRLVGRPLPRGWRREKAFRTSLWFDGLSSRWMDDVAVCDLAEGKAVEPLKLGVSGELLGVFGEADADGLDFQVLVDGKLIRHKPPKGPARDAWSANTKRFGSGRLFFWRVISTDLTDGSHKLEIRPVLPAGAKKGQLRIESVCAAGR